MKKITKIIARNQRIFVGFEVAKRNWKLNIRANRREIARLSMPAEPANLLAYFKEHYPGCKIIVIYEAGFSGFWLHDILVGNGIECVVTPPHTVTEEKNNRVKTDKIDAARMAKNLENDDYKSCHIPSLKRRTDRQLSRSLIQIQKELTRTMVRMRMFLDFHGLLLDKLGRWSAKDYKSAMRMDVGKDLQYPWKILVETLRFFQEQKKALKKTLFSLSGEKDYKDMVRVYSSVPGIGWFTAVRLALEWGDLKRFAGSKKFSSFLGLVCSENSTGETVRKGRITGQGNRAVRSWLIECSWMAIKKDPVLREKFDNVWRHTGSKKKAIVAVARKLAVRLRSLFINNEEYQLGVVH